MCCSNLFKNDKSVPASKALGDILGPWGSNPLGVCLCRIMAKNFQMNQWWYSDKNLKEIHRNYISPKSKVQRNILRDLCWWCRKAEWPCWNLRTQSCIWAKVLVQLRLNLILGFQKRIAHIARHGWCFSLLSLFSILCGLRILLLRGTERLGMVKHLQPPEIPKPMTLKPISMFLLRCLSSCMLRVE